jgi:DNA repair protein RadA/Sms
MREGSSGGGKGLGSVRSVKPSVIVASSAARPITEISTESVSSRSTQVGEFDRVLGGGIVPGAVVLLSGEPGVGKSTLLLEVAAKTAQGGARVLYVSGEESVGQIRLHRLYLGRQRWDLGWAVRNLRRGAAGDQP